MTFIFVCGMIEIWKLIADASVDEKEVKIIIYRTNKKKRKFTQIDNELFYDNSLTPQAKGVLTHMLAQQDSFQFYETELVKHFHTNITQIKNILRELVDKEYLIKTRFRDKGKFYWSYEVFETQSLRKKYDEEFDEST